MKVKIEVLLKTKDMFAFLMNHTYSSISGFVGIILSACAFIAFVYSVDNPNMTIEYKGVLLVTGLLFTVIQPIMLYYKAGKQLKRNEFFKKPINYSFDEKNVIISQDEDKAEYTWEDVFKITSTKKLVILYLTGSRAFVLPKEAFGEQYSTFREIVYKHSQVSRIKLR